MARTATKREVPQAALALKLRRVKLGYSQDELAYKTQEGKEPKDKSSLSQRTISDLEKGNLSIRDLSAGRLSSLLEALRWSMPELAHATGIALPGFVSDSDNVTQVDSLHSSRMIPVYVGVSGGPGLDGGQVVDYVSIPDDWPGEYVAFQIEGSSMEPTIKSGAVVKVRVQDYAEPGQIVVFWSPDHDNCVKEYSGVTPDGYHVFRAHNPELPAEKRTLYLKDVHIKGYVVTVETPINLPKPKMRVN
jgi:SOS-response transcriptional repressor LexA